MPKYNKNLKCRIGLHNWLNKYPTYWRLVEYLPKELCLRRRKCLSCGFEELKIVSDKERVRMKRIRKEEREKWNATL